MRQAVAVSLFGAFALLAASEARAQEAGVVKLKPEMDAGAYMLKDGKLRRVAEELKRPNGIAISADERFLFISDSEDRKLWRLEILPDGSTGRGEPLIDTSNAGTVDGMRGDKAGRVYLALPGGVWVLSPEGEHLGTIAVPDRVSNLAFGDADAKTLYMMNHTTLYRVRLNSEGLRRW